MKRILALAILLAPGIALSQSGTLGTPQQPVARTGVVMGGGCLWRPDPSNPNNGGGGTVEVWLLGSDGTKQDVWSISLTVIELNSLINADYTYVAGEIGTNSDCVAQANCGRKRNYRELAFLKANCATFVSKCPAALTTIVLVP